MVEGGHEEAAVHLSDLYQKRDLFGPGKVEINYGRAAELLDFLFEGDDFPPTVKEDSARIFNNMRIQSDTHVVKYSGCDL